jgi:hypothetical protein
MSISENKNTHRFIIGLSYGLIVDASRFIVWDFHSPNLDSSFSTRGQLRYSCPPPLTPI